MIIEKTIAYAIKRILKGAYSVNGY